MYQNQATDKIRGKQDEMNEPKHEARYHSYFAEYETTGVDFHGDTAYIFTVTLGRNKNSSASEMREYLSELLEEGL